MTFKSKRIIIVISEFNFKVTNGLLEGALKVFDENDGDRKLLDIIKVPGAFDIPSAAIKAIEKNNPDALITLGAVIKGETKHFEYISENCSRAVMDISLNYDMPVLFGVLTTENSEQALARSDKKNNKGAEVMEAALKMIDTFKKIEGES